MPKCGECDAEFETVPELLSHPCVRDVTPQRRTVTDRINRLRTRLQAGNDPARLRDVMFGILDLLGDEL